MNQKKRKQRVVKNALVVTDDILSECDQNCANWLKISKQKLLKREKQILSLRMNAIKTIIIDVVDELNNNLNINGKSLLNMNISIFVNQCINKIQLQLNEWNGIKNRNPSNFATFRDYFRKCKNWFDQKKIKIMADFFWIPIIKIIKQFNQERSNKYESLNEYINYSVFLCLIQGFIKIPNTKKTLLISASIYNSKYEFVKELHLNELLCNQILSGKEIRNLTINRLINLMNDKLKELNKLNNNNNNNMISNDMLTNWNNNNNDNNLIPYNQCNDNIYNNNNNNNYNNNLCTICRPICCPICCVICNNNNNNNHNNNNNNNIDNNGNYNNFNHCSSQSVSEIRYNPMT